MKIFNCKSGGEMKSRKYTLSEAARRQRIKAAKMRKALVNEWATVKIDVRNSEWCKRRFGTVNEAIETLKEMEGKNV